MKFNLLTSYFLLFLLVFTSACGGGNDEEEEIEIEVTAEGIFINEISASGEDWIELYNGLSSSGDLSGYTISDSGNEYLLPSGTTIPAGGYVVLLCNDLGTGLNTNFKLSAIGELVSFKNASGTLIDAVEYPSLDNGQSYARFPDGTDTWKVTGSTSQGVSNGGENTPAINKIFHLPIVPSLNDNVVVTAELISIDNVADVKLYYRFNGNAFTEVAMSLASGTLYVGNIPAIGSAGSVDYYVEAVGTNGESTFKPASAPENTEDYLLNTDVLPQLVINEFMAINNSCCVDTDGVEAAYDDWIEIYNMGTTSVNIAGMYLSDNVGDPFGDKISNDDASVTTIPAGGFLLLWADGSTEQGANHLNFNLSADGEDIGLFYIDGRTIDSYTFGAQSEDVSEGRATNGGDTWRSFSNSTPGASNN
ncbi:MAG: hypothetical protein ACI83W_002013 [Marinoscillum sp.]|jgi:hypothetical protein